MAVYQNSWQSSRYCLATSNSYTSGFNTYTYYSGIKAFSNLPTYVKNLLQTKKHFKRALKEYLHFNSFYSLSEFYNYNRP